MVDNPTADWNALGPVFYRKFEVYSMQWRDQVDLSQYRTAAAPYGGPIALMKDDRRSRQSAAAKPLIRIYNGAGQELSVIKWDWTGRLVAMEWSMTEDLVCVLDDGSVVLHGIDGQHKRLFSMGQECREHRVIDAKVFNNGPITGVAVLTGNYQFYVVSDVTQELARIRHLARISGFEAPPSSWLVLPEERQIRILVALDSQIYLVDAVQAVLQRPPVDNMPSSWIAMASSFTHKFLAMFGNNGVLWVGTSNLKNVYSEVNTNQQDRQDPQAKPDNLVWCGSGAILYSFDTLICMVGPEKDCAKYFIEPGVILVPEIDGLRFIDNASHEFLQKVPDMVEKVHKFGSLAPGAVLYYAMKEFERKSPKADEYVRSVKEHLDEAIDQCTHAAGDEYEPARQRSLLRAAGFGKCFVTQYDPKPFVQMCSHLRVLNAVRDYRVAMPLTYVQMETLTMPVLIDRLVLRRQYCLAIKIADYLKIPPHEGASHILGHWACYKVQQSAVDDVEVANTIVSKLGDTPGISYTEIATKAKDCGRTELAIRLLDYEPRSADQVPLLMKMKYDELALEKAIESGDTDLVYTVVMHLRDNRELADFLMFIRGYEPAMALFAQYCRQQDRQMLIDLYYQDDRSGDSANIHLQDALSTKNLSDILEKLTRAQVMYTQAQNKFAAEVTNEHIKLVQAQQAMQERTNKPFIGLSVSDTIFKCLVCDFRSTMAERLRKDFKVPDKRFWWLKIRALAETSQWLELENFSKSKKSPIGYEPFVDVCLDNGSRNEAMKYVKKMTTEHRPRAYMRCKAWDLAAEDAFASRNEEALDQIIAKSGAGHGQLHERIHEMKMQLRQR
ncbi:vacuolar protein sorting-associated protein 16 homolog [Sycon ciliatum]|uniref:vacuolar protein sorting-associated protein 16 homolog n=1 Tax=Sycon ciliatum TaxID=27933 RepID=UPI0020A893ED|eukprot:scpid44749/ scgid28047/ Vacuolar protein sorting-associated protein 16 homolog